MWMMGMPKSLRSLFHADTILPVQFFETVKAPSPNEDR